MVESIDALLAAIEGPGSSKKKSKQKKATAQQGDKQADVSTQGNAPNGDDKGTKKEAEEMHDIEGQSNSHLRRVGDWPAVATTKQTLPPTVPVDKAYSKGSFPLGEILEHPGANNQARISGEEYRDKERKQNVNYDDIRRAAEAHRQTRKYFQSFIKPDMSTLEIVQKLEAKSLEMINAKGLSAGFAFPTGFSIDHCAAHYTPNYGEPPMYFRKNSIAKVDFGVHVGGRLVDCAFSVAFDEKFDPLIQATQEATNQGLRVAGIDAKFSEVGAAIEEVIRSYEIELNNKVYEIKPIENLNGHTVAPYRVHGGKSLPIVGIDIPDIMEEGEVYAIETFASTGSGHVWESGDCSHFMFDEHYQNYKIPTRIGSAKTVYNAIKKEFGTLAFCRRWLDDRGCTRHIMGLKALQDAGIVNPYPPLVDTEGCYTSQMEHTILLRPTCKEIVTRGPDY